MEQIDASLTRLGTDYVDLYQIHRFDPDDPVEETMEALHDVVKAGKARYLGASSMWAWQFAKMQHAADRQRLDPVRVHAGPVQPVDARGGAGDVRPAGRPGRRAASRTARWPRAGSPGRGASSTQRFDIDPVGRRFDIDRRRPIVEAVQQVAEARGIPMAQVALAWVLRNPVVTAPIVGPPSRTTSPMPSRPSTSSSATTRCRILEEPYAPHLPTAF